MAKQGTHAGIMGGARTPSTRRDACVRHTARTLVAIGAVAVVAATMAGCAAAPSRDGVAVVASGADLESANPLVTVHPMARQIQRYVLFTTLARYDSTLTPVPYLARRWRWSSDRRSLTLTLVSDLRWHDGVPTTARDVAFTLDAARDPRTGSPRAGELANIRNVAAIDDTTLVIDFSTPQPLLPDVFCQLPIVPEHLLRNVPRDRMRTAAFATAPVGNGPFRFVERVAGQHWTFERNADFPESLGGPPSLRRLVVAVVDEPATKMAGLVSGDLDMAGIAPTMAGLVQRDPTLRLVEYPNVASVALVFNPHQQALGDRRVREAISLSIDRARIVAAAVGGFATIAHGPVPDASPFAIPAEGAVHDTLRADSLLDAAGWRRGTDGRRGRAGAPLTLELLTVGSGDNVAEQLIQADLAARGITVAIRQLELGAFLARARATPHRYDMLLTGIPGDLALSHIVAMYDGTLRGGALDYSGFHTATLDSLFRRVRAAPDPGALRDAWAAVQRELAREMPAAWIYHSRGIQGVARRLGNVTMDLRGELPTVARWTTTGDVRE
jgi:peptide/nickel transport system substrate-binding protein